MDDVYSERSNPFEQISQPALFVIAGLFALVILIVMFSSNTGIQTGRVVENISTGNIYVVKITDNGFKPSSISVKVGDGIELRNRASTPHTIASSNWASDLIFPGEEYLIPINEPGEYEYFSINEKTFRGTITVLP